jgi:hypothetical protein
MLDKAKVIQVSSGLLEINKVYKRPRFIFTKKKAQFEAAREGSTFVGNFSLDDWSLVEKVTELLELGYSVLAIAEEQDFVVNVYKA